MTGDIKGLGIYHRVYASETFGDGAEALFIMVRDASRKYPGRPRFLYLDIDGHDGSDGWDEDASALLAWFVPEVLGQWLTEYRDGDGNKVRNPGQRDDVPDGMLLASKGEGGPKRVIGVEDGQPASLILVLVRSTASLDYHLSARARKTGQTSAQRARPGD